MSTRKSSTLSVDPAPSSWNSCMPLMGMFIWPVSEASMMESFASLTSSFSSSLPTLIPLTPEEAMRAVRAIGRHSAIISRTPSIMTDRGMMDSPICCV